MKIKGIKRGKAIELSQEINIPDGQEVNIEIEVIQNRSNEEKLQKMKEFLESLSDEDREEWAKIGDFLEKERQLDRQIQQQKINEINVR
ncbi:MAG: hypothetical protein U7127_04045 [Phormidium sp.]